MTDIRHAVSWQLLWTKHAMFVVRGRTCHGQADEGITSPAVGIHSFLLQDCDPSGRNRLTTAVVSPVVSPPAGQASRWKFSARPCVPSCHHTLRVLGVRKPTNRDAPDYPSYSDRQSPVVYERWRHTHPPCFLSCANHRCGRISMPCCANFTLLEVS
ncbi:hypothetical protein LZ30DRAFT_314140 [Colletotrichum cereale]|nr:hypothetical protein LZ30DRAFT_314140 [Colletotrichum cereale]